ncbi:MAG: hypothetical protein ACOH14_09280 [Rhodoglobus sp.]
MDEAAVNLQTDRELLDVAQAIFEQQGYAIESVQVGAAKLLLVENAYFLVCVVATPTINQLIAFEGIAEAVLTRRISEGEIGPKRWDAYLVLLTQERSPETREVTRALFDINYDTSRLRRIAHAGVIASDSAVRAALSSFISPTGVEDSEISEDPYSTLTRELVAQGVDQQLVQRAVDAFEKGVSLDEVL